MNTSARWLLVVLAWTAGLAGARAAGAEPVAQFLEALRARKYYDEAVDYLQQVEANAALDEELRTRVPYEQGVTLLASAADHADPQVRQTRLARASELLEAFCAKHPSHPLAPSARNQLAGVLVERGRGELLAAGTPPEQSAAESARTLFAEAREEFDAAEKELEAQLAKLPKLVAPDDHAQQALKRQLSGDLAQARLWRASLDYELARTYEASSAAARKHYAAAAKSYAALYETYRTRAAGLLARLWEGRCHQALGDFSQALGCFGELMDLADSPESAAIRAKSTRHALECWTHPEVKKYEAAIERGQRWEKEAGLRATDPDTLAIRYLTALAYREQAQALPDRDPNRKRLTGAAREHAEPVAEHPGEYQRPAKMLLVALAGNTHKTQSKDEKPPDGGFAEAYELARESLGKLQAVSNELAAGKSPQQADALRKAKANAAADALEQLRRAISLAGPETPIEDLNSARYYLCWLSWDLGHFEDALVLGEYLANRAPDSLPGRQGAKIALAAAVRLYGESKAEDRSFEVAQIERIAEMTFRRWPDQEEAEEAALTLVNFAAAGQQVERAMAYLEKISPDSPRRGQAELRAGQALWSAYLRALRLPEEERPPADKLAPMRKQAEEILTKGLARGDKSGAVDATVTSAAFSLAQMALEAGQPQRAIELLTNGRYGPLVLVKKGSPAVAREGFAVETYKLALRAYVSVQPQQFEQAEEAMDALEKLVQKSGDAQASENLTAIYISLGRQLEEQLQELRQSGKTKQLDAVSEAFETFLDRVVERNAGGSYASLNWIAETYYSLGAGFDEGGAKKSPRATAYFQKATEAYERMLGILAKDPKYQEQPDALVALRLRLAECYGRSGKFDQAIKTVTEVLEAKPSLLTAQVQAAKIYQAQGAADPKSYALAILGAQPKRDGQNRVWGWAKISKMTMSNPKFDETFHDARLQIAEARYRYALTQQDAARKTKTLEAAVQDLWQTYKLRPDLGGEETTARYDRTLKMIQKALGQPETGLAEFKKREAQTASAEAKP